MECIFKNLLSLSLSLIRSQSFTLKYSNYLMFLIFSTPYRFLYVGLIKLKKERKCLDILDLYLDLSKKSL